MALHQLRTAAQQALAWLGPDPPECCGCREEWQQAIDVLRGALAEEAMQRLTDVQQEIEADLSRCPKCGGPADNGHDRSIPPNPYFCTKCMAEPTVTSDCPNSHQLTDEVIADLWHQNGGFHHHFARAIERWLKGNP